MEVGDGLSIRLRAEAHSTGGAIKAASQFVLVHSTPTLLTVYLTWVDDQIINSNVS
jgi:hypothetical protein